MREFPNECFGKQQVWLSSSHEISLKMRCEIELFDETFETVLVKQFPQDFTGKEMCRRTPLQDFLDETGLVKQFSHSKSFF